MEKMGAEVLSGRRQSLEMPDSTPKEANKIGSSGICWMGNTMFSQKETRPHCRQSGE
jgi:hypothetical protein